MADWEITRQRLLGQQDAKPSWDLAVKRAEEFYEGPSWENTRNQFAPTTPSFPDESIESAKSEAWSAIKRIGSIGGKGLWSGLGVIAWPFQRIEYTIGSPLSVGAERFGAQLGGREVTPPPAKEFGKAALAGLKTWRPGKEVPEEAKTFDDVFGAYYKGMTGEEAPEWYKKVAGAGASFLITPRIFSGILKAAGKPIKAIMKGRQVPLWQRAKLRARAKVGARVTKAEEVGTQLAKKDIDRLSKELSEQAGVHIGPAAVKQRIAQVIKGGITTRPGIQEAANPAIQEFTQNFKELQRLGVLPKEVFTTKLPRRRLAELITQRAKLRSELAKLSEAPYQKTLLKSAEKLTPNVAKQKQLTDRFINIAIKAEQQGKKITDLSDEFIDAAIEVTTGSPLSKNIAKLLDFAPGDKRLTYLGSRLLSLEKMERAARNKEAKKILDVAAKIGPRVAKYTSKITDDILKAASQIEDTKVIGKISLLKKIRGMRRTFPGKAAKTQDLESKIEAITERIQTSYKVGDTGYFPRMYIEKEAEAVPSLFRRATQRVRAPYAKKRALEPVRGLTTIKEPAYPVTKRLIQQGSDIETSKLFDFASRQPSLASKVWSQGLKSKPLPDTQTFGALRGMHVHPQVYNDVMELTRIKSNFEKLYDTAIGTWKLGKVVWNPATHFRNKFSNKILLDLSGMGYGEQAKYAAKALGHYRNNSKEYQIAKGYFARTTHIRGEILDDLLKSTSIKQAEGFSGALDDVNAFVGKVSKKPSALYQHEEFTNKFMKYLQMRDKGKSVIESVEEANKWLFDYSELSRWEKVIARRVMPFYTFPRKALPRVLEAAATRPYTIAKYPLAAKMMTQYSLYKLDMTDKDYKEIQKVLPEYMKNGSYILMPYRDKNGDLRFFDWTYIVPWGELYEAQEAGLLKTGITNPLFQLTADISRNKSGWSGREIWKETDTTREKTYKSMEYIWQGLVPSLAYKGIYWDKIKESATGKPSKAGKVRPIPETIAHTLFGLRTQAVDVDLAKRFHVYKTKKRVSELQSKMADIVIRRSTGNITDEEFIKLRDQYLSQARGEIEELR